MTNIIEPPINHDDTSPSLITRPPGLQRRRSSGWQSTIAWMSLIGAGLFTLGTIALLLMPAPAEPTPTLMPPTTDNTVVQAPTTQPTEDTTLVEIPTDSPVIEIQPGDATTLDGAMLDILLTTPIAPDGTRFTLNYDPFTIITSDRPRSSFVNYTIVKGDTIDAISRRYNLKSESIAWCNDRRIIFVLRVGDVLTIPPMDGTCHTVIGTRQETVTQLAEKYKVANPLDIIDFPLNNLYGTDPNEPLLGGLTLFIPGGEAEAITWSPGYNTEKDENGNVVSVAFAAGQAGSCGNVAAGGGAFWSNPLPGGKWVRGFYAGHTGIDLSAAIGTPIYAANSGPVLFSGLSRWGYGEAIVLAHGPFSTLYGHMSARNVSCGQAVNVGDIIGLVGSTGNSSGPHLHFEIRYNDVPQNPSSTPGIGW
jgi:murein DD-endopeptidase MepM/ murein hydrolase activator NlpD